MLVAIDGPAGSGKSSVARAVARRLGLVNLDTGTTYRAVALVALREGVDLEDENALSIIGDCINLAPRGVSYDGEPILEDALRSPEVSAAASKVSAHPELRKVLVQRQRAAAQKARASGGAVVEGRDIGTVVLPEAELKIFLSASPEERARRRALQTGREGELQRIREAMQTRDRRDSEREASPLRPAPDAVVLDTTDLSLEGVVSRVVELAREAQNAASRGKPKGA
ncbi:MAG: (d)CMP kinase [Actinomycetota bacterium]|nr:(d)CMP kinase [Actinomycetota bacterium]